MLNCSILKTFGQFWGDSKKLEIYYQNLINRVFEQKNVQLVDNRSVLKKLQ